MWETAKSKIRIRNMFRVPHYVVVIVVVAVVVMVAVVIVLVIVVFPI